MQNELLFAAYHIRFLAGVFWGDDDERNLSEPLGGRQTNNRAEIHSAIRAIEQAQEYGLSRLEIRTDSKFLVRSMTEWVRLAYHLRFNVDFQPEKCLP